MKKTPQKKRGFLQGYTFLMGKLEFLLLRWRDQSGHSR